MRWIRSRGAVIIALLVTAVLVWAAVITENDSTQPRGSPGGANADGQLLDPINEGFRAPQRFPGPIAGEDNDFYHEWSASIMAYAMRDPSFFATLNVANEDFINYLKTLSDADLNQFLLDNQLDDDRADVYRVVLERLPPPRGGRGLQRLPSADEVPGFSDLAAFPRS